MKSIKNCFHCFIKIVLNYRESINQDAEILTENEKNQPL